MCKRMEGTYHGACLQGLAGQKTTDSCFGVFVSSPAVSVRGSVYHVPGRAVEAD